MRGQANEASLGEGAAWANQSGFGWDAPAVKRAAEKVRDTRPGFGAITSRLTAHHS